MSWTQIVVLILITLLVSLTEWKKKYHPDHGDGIFETNLLARILLKIFAIIGVYHTVVFFFWE